MYQGKFLAENKGAANAEQLKRAEAKLTADEIMDKEAAVQELPIHETPTPEANAVSEKPAEETKAKKKKKGIRVGTVIFYLLYLMLIGAAAYGIHYGLGLLNDWLTVFEASQPDTRSQEIFNDIFADPDWGKIYDMAGLEGTQFEGKDAYVEYMRAKVGDSELTYSKTSAGLSGGQKYIVKLGDEKVATFTMQNPVVGELEIPEWSLDTVEAGFFTRNEDVTILTQPGRTVTLNGVPLDESYVVKTTATVVDSYLPEGIHGPRTVTLYAKGFLVAPEVMVIDASGAAVELKYHEESNTYSEDILLNPVTQEISKEEYDALLDATYAYSKAMIGADKEGWKKLFDKNSQIYSDIRGLVGNNSFFKGWTRYNFEKETITEYHRYTDTLFSARIEVKLNTYRKDGSVKPFEINTTMFLEKNSKGKWLVNNMTNVDVHKTKTQVRMTYMLEDMVLSSDMVDTSNRKLVTPTVEVPEGKVFAGWFRETQDANGDTTYSLVFALEEGNEIHLPDNYLLEPMVLHALFETKGE